MKSELSEKTIAIAFIISMLLGLGFLTFIVWIIIKLMQHFGVI